MCEWAFLVTIALRTVISIMVGRGFRNANQLTIVGQSINLGPVPPVVLNPLDRARPLQDDLDRLR